MSDLYIWLKSFHIIAIIFWMAGLLLLPRLFIYHSRSIKGGELEQQMLIAESRLLNIIMNPSMIISFILGLTLIFYRIDQLTDSFWLIIKLGFVFVLMSFHVFLMKMQKAFVRGERPKNERFFRMINEVPAIIAILIVILAVVEPF